MIAVSVTLAFALAAAGCAAWHADLVPKDWPVLSFEEGLGLGLFGAGLVNALAAAVAGLVQ